MQEIMIYTQAQPMHIKEYQGQRVVTLKDIDTLHQRAEGTARRNFNENKERFILGEDYFKVCADEIRTLKLMDISNKAREDVTLITKIGYLMLVKSFNDDLAWHIQRQLVNNYFDTHTQPQASTNNSRLDRLITLLEKQVKSLCVESVPLLPEPTPQQKIILESERPNAKYDMAELKTKTMLTKSEAAFYINVGNTTFTDIINSGNFYPLIRIGHNRGKVFINREKLDQWLDEQDGSYKYIR